MNQKLVHTLNGINYLLFECPFPISEKHKLDSFYKEVNKLKGIIQGAEKVSGGFWGDSYIKINVLIPEDKAFYFSSEME